MTCECHIDTVTVPEDGRQVCHICRKPKPEYYRLVRDMFGRAYAIARGKDHPRQLDND